MPILANGIAFDEGTSITQSPRLRSGKGVPREEADSGEPGCEESSRSAAKGLLAMIYQEWARSPEGGRWVRTQDVNPNAEEIVFDITAP